jgi:hypothetical protein
MDSLGALCNLCGKNSALLARHGIECGGFLLHILAAAFRALDVGLVFFEGKNQLKSPVAIVTDVVVYGHADLPLEGKRATR